MRLQVTSYTFFPWRMLLYQRKNPADLPHPRNSLMQSTEGQSVYISFVRLKQPIQMNDYL